MKNIFILSCNNPFCCFLRFWFLFFLREDNQVSYI